jgi:hypothetical protein
MREKSVREVDLYEDDDGTVPLPPDNCLNPRCKNPVKSRGLCRGCYQRARELVLSHQITWAELEENGKILKKHIARRRRSSRTLWLLGDL